MGHGWPLELLAAKYMEVEVVDGLVRVLSIVCHYAIALDVFFAANSCNSDHHVTK